MRIGILSDTHQPLDQKTIWDEIHVAFAGVDLILHSGDIVSRKILDQLQVIAPVLAARGNHDFDWDDERMEDVQWVEAEGRRIGMTHAIEPEDRPIEVLRDLYFAGQPIDIMISGDSHIERMDYRDGVLQINPGSPTLPHHQSTRLGSVALLEIEGDRLEARIIRLGEHAGKPNPCREFHFTPETGVVRLG